MPPPRENELPSVKKLFVNRRDALRIFEDAAFSIPSGRSALLVYHGFGGQGKTAIFRELWRITSGKVEPSYLFLRRAQIDLHGRPKHDPDLLLVWIRNGFADEGVATPAFDLALALIWEATRGEEPFPKLSKPWLHRPTTIAKAGLDEFAGAAKGWLKGDTAKEVIGEAVGQIPGVGFVLKRIGSWAIDKGKRQYLEWSREALQQLYVDGEMRKPYELSELLPKMLASDLNLHLVKHPTNRFVLFVDEYERVFLDGGIGSRWEENLFDRQLRTFVQYSNGLLVVIFAREQLPWMIDPDWRDDLIGRQHLIEGLRAEDAIEILRAVPIDDSGIVNAIVDSARIDSVPQMSVYPLLLELQIEHWRRLWASGLISVESFQVDSPSFEGRRREIVGRLLRDFEPLLQSAIETLSVANRIDRAAFEHMMTAFGIGVGFDAFDTYSSLSFVSKGEDEFATMNPIVAGAVRGTLSDERRNRTISALMLHYVARANPDAVRDVDELTTVALFEAAYLRRGLGANGYSEWLKSVSDTVMGAGRYKSLLPLWQEAHDYIVGELGNGHLDAAASADVLGTLLHLLGDNRTAKPLLEHAASIRKTVLGQLHPDTATSMSHLGLVRMGLGDYLAAKEAFSASLSIRREVLSSVDATIGISEQDLGNALRGLGDLVEAREWFEKALSTFEAAKNAGGSFNPAVLSVLNNLGIILMEQGHLLDAEGVLEDNLRFREEYYGGGHPEVATALMNLSVCLQKQDRYSEAIAACERSLAIAMERYGEEHPAVAKALNNKASLLKSLGQLDSSEALQRQAVERCENVFGSEHPETAKGLLNLGTIHHAKGELALALSLYDRARGVWERTLGLEHIDTAVAYNNTGSVLLALRRRDEARSFLQTALKIRERVLGVNHRDTRRTAGNLATLHLELGELDRAGPLLVRSMNAWDEEGEGAYLERAITRSDLAAYYLHKRDYGSARALAMQAIAEFEAVEGTGNSSMITSLNTMATTYIVEKSFEQADKLLSEGLTIATKCLGTSHQATLTTLDNLAMVKKLQGDYNSARKLWQRALRISEKILGTSHAQTQSIMIHLSLVRKLRRAQRKQRR